jgi:hypothetical protein
LGGYRSDDGSVLIPAGHRIENRPFGEFFWLLSGNQLNAAVARSAAERPLRPRTGLSANIAERPVPDR